MLLDHVLASSHLHIRREDGRWLATGHGPIVVHGANWETLGCPGVSRPGMCIPAALLPVEVVKESRLVDMALVRADQYDPA